MKIYILRHEDRTNDCSMFSPLTLMGIEKSRELASTLEKLNINKIYSSPFIRTLQTIYPFIKDNNKKVNLEYGLSEIHHKDIIPKKAVGIHLPEYIAESFNYNKDYATKIKPNEIVYPESTKEVSKRLRHFLKELFKENIETDNVILIVSHQTICTKMLNIANNAMRRNKKHIELRYLESYDKGKLCLVYDNDWTFHLLN